MDDQASADDRVTADDDLVIRAKTDRAAFGLLYDRYYPRVARYCLRRLFDPAIAEDVTSDAFLKVATHLQEFSGRTETDFRCWLFRIATNAVNAHLRQSKRRQELWKAAARSRHLGPSGGSQALSAEYDTLDWPAVYLALLELDDRDQTIVTLRFFAGCSHEEIADIVNAKVGAVRTALSRTLTRLREKFDPPIPPASMPGKSSQG
jgi:RNA polymerase sigma-70 factor (ECF subfamily)